MQLASHAMPAEKYGWRPGEGVRSVGEVFNHVSSANYFFPTFWNGGKAPADVDLRSFEKTLSNDKAKTIDTLKKSFDYVRQAIIATPEADLDRQIKIFGEDATVRDAMMVVGTPRPRASRPVDRLRPLERRRAAVERQGGLGTRKAPHLPGPPLPALHPPCRGEEGEKQRKLLRILSCFSPSLPGRGGWRAGREGLGSEGSAAPTPSRSRKTLSIARRSASRRPCLLISSPETFTGQSSSHVVDHRRLPDLLLRIPIPVRIA